MQIAELEALLEAAETQGVLPVLSEPAQTAFIHALKECGWKCKKNANDQWEISRTSPRPSLDSFQEKYDQALAPEDQWKPGQMPATPDPEDFATLQLINLQAILRPNPKSILAPQPEPGPALLLSTDAARILKIALQDKDLRDNLSKLAQQNAITGPDNDKLQKNLDQMRLNANDQNAFNRYFHLQPSWTQAHTPLQVQVQARATAIQKAISMVMELPPEQREGVKQSLIERLSKEEPISKLGSQLKSSAFSTIPRPPKGYPY